MALNINTTDVSADGLSPSPSTITTTRTEVPVAAVLGVFASCDCYPLPNSTPPADSTPTCSQVANTRTSMAPRYSALSIATLVIDSSSLNGSSHSEYHKGQVVHVQSREVRLLIGYFTLIRQICPSIVLARRRFESSFRRIPERDPEHLVG